MHIDKNLRLKLDGKLPLLLQSEASECGLACMAMIASYHGYLTDIAELRKQFTVSLKGMTLDHIIAVADNLGINSGRCDWNWTSCQVCKRRASFIGTLTTLWC